MNWIICILDFIIIFYITVILSNRLIHIIIKNKFEQSQDEKGIDKTSQLIGILERALIFFGILINNWTLITIVMAIKSIGRYKELDTKEFAEKFIIGTLLSFIIAVLGAYLYIFIVDYFNLCGVLQNRF